MIYNTEKLFYKNQYIREFKAEVKSVVKNKDEYYVILDRTAFFPGGGGQSSDLGYIDNKEVLKVLEDNGNIIHVLREEIKEDIQVECRINWSERLDGMQQHLAQHVISGCFYKIFNINTAGIHLGSDISTIDFPYELTEEQVRKVELEANNIIINNHRVEFIETNRKKAKLMGLRRDLQTKDDEIRIVKIHDLDINACCGLHPNTTLELQLIKIKGFERHKGNTRLYFLAGNRAVKDYLKRDLILENACKYLSAGDEELIKTLKNLNEEMKLLKDESSNLKNKLSEYERKELINNSIKINNISLIKCIYENENMKYLTKLANKLTEDENVIVLFGNINRESGNMLFCRSKNINNLNMGALLSDGILLIDGKGGGSPILAQGGGKNISNMENALSYVERRIKELL